MSEPYEGPSHYIAGKWIDGSGPDMRSTDPATDQPNWQGHAATEAEVDQAVATARRAARSWAEADLGDRIRLVEAIGRQYAAEKTSLAEAICRETGKPRWEALTEVDAMVNKVPLSIDAYHERLKSTRSEKAGVTSATRFKPHEVLAVLGPFNMPGHLPNGHIIPALIAGNTIVFKPSEQTPLVGQRMAELFAQAGLPAGVVNAIQGGRETGEALARHPGLDGLLFTGSFGAGRALGRIFADHPGKMLALEMGGNNPLIVHRAADLTAAAYHTIQSAYITSGQRCSCARRLIVPQGDEGDAFLGRLTELILPLRVAPYTVTPEPFMGPVISVAAAENLLQSQQNLITRGAKPLVEMRRLRGSSAMLFPGLIDVTAVPDRPDEEIFGPLLQVIRVPDFDAALREANHTHFGLSAGLFSDDRALYDRFARTIRAGVVNWNRPLTGASSALPFGGACDSGNNRPSGYYAVDYCAFPVASLEAERVSMPPQVTPGVVL